MLSLGSSRRVSRSGGRGKFVLGSETEDFVEFHRPRAVHDGGVGVMVLEAFLDDVTLTVGQDEGDALFGPLGRDFGAGALVGSVHQFLRDVKVRDDFVCDLRSAVRSAFGFGPAWTRKQEAEKPRCGIAEFDCVFHENQDKDYSEVEETNASAHVGERPDAVAASGLRFDYEDALVGGDENDGVSGAVTVVDDKRSDEWRG